MMMWNLGTSGRSESRGRWSTLRTVDLMEIMPSGCVDVVFADPPYRLSRGGVTVRNGRLASVDKGAWDRSLGFVGNHQFNVRWLEEACRILRPGGTIWVTGTHHIIFSL